MNMDPEQHMILVRSQSQWVEQAHEALDAIEAANGGVLPEHLRDGHAVAPEAFSRLIEALYALHGGNVSDELVRLAGLVPVDQALGE